MNLDNLQVKGTVVSFFPKDVPDQYKPDLVPANYTIRAGDPVTKKPGVTHINSCRRRVYVGDDRGGMQSHLVAASEVCESLVNDFIKSCIYVFDEGKPAIFWVPDIVKADDILKAYPKEVEQALNQQIRWFKVLIDRADETWSKIKNPRSITDIQKYAASYLKLDREWVLDQEIAHNLSVCPLCTAKVSPAAIVCMNCKAVLKQAEYDAYMKKTTGVKVGA